MIDRKDNSQLLRKRSFVLGGLKTLFTLIVFGKLYHLQILDKLKYGKLSDLNRIKVKILYPERGIIYDLHNNPIALNKADFQLNIFREKVDLINDYISSLSNVIKFSEQDLADLKENIKNKDLSDFIIMKKNLDWSQLERFELISNNFPFLIINQERARSYKNNFIFSHVIG